MRSAAGVGKVPTFPFPFFRFDAADKGVDFDKAIKEVKKES